jgi:hypothetical protein
MKRTDCALEFRIDAGYLALMPKLVRASASNPQHPTVGSKTMELNHAGAEMPAAEQSPRHLSSGNGNGSDDSLAGEAPRGETVNGHSLALHELLHALQAMRTGNFSVRLPTDRTGLEGKIATRSTRLSRLTNGWRVNWNTSVRLSGVKAKREHASASAWPVAPGAGWKHRSTN